MAAAIGNQYAARGRVWRQAIERALAKRSRVEQVEMLDELADKLVTLAHNGDLAALRELGDRLEGKPSQALEMSGPDGAPIPTSLKVEFVKPNAGAVPGQT